MSTPLGDLESIGYVSSSLQIGVQQVRRIADELGITPATRINGVPHYSAADVERIGDYLRNPNGPTNMNPLIFEDPRARRERLEAETKLFQDFANGMAAKVRVNDEAKAKQIERLAQQATDPDKTFDEIKAQILDLVRVS